MSFFLVVRAVVAVKRLEAEVGVEVKAGFQEVGYVAVYRVV